MTTGATRQVPEGLTGASVSVRRALTEIVAVAREIEREYDRVLVPFDLTLPQYQILASLRVAGPRGLRPDEFGRRLRRFCAEPGCQQHLERQGLIERSRTGDRTITAVGRRRLGELDPFLEELEDRITERTGAAELESARVALSRLQLDEGEIE